MHRTLAEHELEGGGTGGLGHVHLPAAGSFEQLHGALGLGNTAVWEKPDVANRLILDFLADEQVAKMFIVEDD